MDKLAIVDAVFDHTMGVAGAFATDNDILGFGVGYKSSKAVKARKNESYAIVVYVSPDISEEKFRALPKKIRMGKAEIPALAGLIDIPKNVTVHIRVEKRRVVRVAEQVAFPVAAALATTVLTGGDPVFSAGGTMLGTAGYVFNIRGIPQLVSNNHVLEGIGVGNLVSNATGIPLARVSELHPEVDSAFAALEPGVTFAPDIPGIGTPTVITPGIDLGMTGKKRGASTGKTEFNILNKKATLSGIPCVVGISINGKNDPAVGVGDSGSIVVGQSNEVLGLVFGGFGDLGVGPKGALLSEIWIVDIARALPGISLP